MFFASFVFFEVKYNTPTKKVVKITQITKDIKSLYEHTIKLSNLYLGIGIYPSGKVELFLGES